MLLFIFCLWNVKKYIYRIVEKRGQLFRRAGVLLSVVSRARSSHGSGFTYPQQRLPTNM